LKMRATLSPGLRALVLTAHCGAEALKGVADFSAAFAAPLRRRRSWIYRRALASMIMACLEAALFKRPPLRVRLWRKLKRALGVYTPPLPPPVILPMRSFKRPWLVDWSPVHGRGEAGPGFKGEGRPRFASGGVVHRPVVVNTPPRGRSSTILVDIKGGKMVQVSASDAPPAAAPAKRRKPTTSAKAKPAAKRNAPKSAKRGAKPAAKRTRAAKSDAVKRARFMAGRETFNALVMGAPFTPLAPYRLKLHKPAKARR